MKIIKKVQGHEIILEYRKIKEYPHGYTLYDVYNFDRFLYKTCLTELDIIEIKRNKYTINEVFY